MSGNVLELNEQSFSEAIKSDLPIVVDFWAPWCGPCRMMAPIIEEASEKYNGKIKFAKLNVDNNQSPAMQYGVQGIPTMIVFKNSEEIDRNVGALAPEDFDKFLQKNIGEV